jgi:hypothetical protein
MRTRPDQVEGTLHRRSGGLVEGNEFLPAARTVRLLEGSTFWPGLLALRLRDQDGKTTSLLVLPDSVAPGAFRALSLSLRWIASQDSERAPMHNEF